MHLAVTPMRSCQRHEERARGFLTGAFPRRILASTVREAASAQVPNNSARAAIGFVTEGPASAPAVTPLTLPGRAPNSNLGRDK
jgi:hypothetical protein